MTQPGNSNQHESYAWDGTGEPDPAVQRLENAARAGGLNASSQLDWDREQAADARITRRQIRSGLAVAAVIAVGLAIAAYFMNAGPFHTGWNVQVLAGNPRLGDRIAASSDRIRPGQWLETGATDRATIQVAAIGTITVEPDTRVQFIRSDDKQHRIDLQHGRIEAFITAPPRLFFVETPHATAIDMGCEYILDIEPDGSGWLEVTLGLVELERHGRVCRIPRGVICKIIPNFGPGTPYRKNASEPFIKGLPDLDAAAVPNQLAELLQLAEREDAVTLWHLLWTCQGAARETVFERLAALCPPPARITKRSILLLEQPALDAWWDVMAMP